MKRKRFKRYPLSVQVNAVKRMQLGVNISELAEELSVSRQTLYLWQTRLTGKAMVEVRAVVDPLEERDYRIRELEARVAGLEGELGRRELEKGFFEAALRRIEASRRKKEDNGATASSPRSATGRTRKAD